MKTGELQKWDMQMFVTEARKLSKDPKFYSNEAVEVNWMGIEEILERCKEKDHSKYLQSVKNMDWPRFIQPKLVSSKDKALWHSILPKDIYYNDEKASANDISKCKGPFQRITMKLNSGKFHSFELICGTL